MWKTVLIIIAVLLGTYRVLALRKHDVTVLAALGFSLDRHQLVNIAVGAAIGTIAISGIFLLELWCKLLTVSHIGPVSAMIKDFSTFIMVPLMEETVFRCAILGALLLVIKQRSVAIVISAAVFGSLHAFNPNATVLSVLSTTLGGLAYSVAFASTERIWLPFGLHFGWNYTQARVFGFSISGSPVHGPAPFIQQHDLGPALVTGGAYGPEGGLLGLCARILVLALIAVWLIVEERRRRVIDFRDSKVCQGSHISD